MTVNIGKPLNVTEFVRTHEELDRPQLIMALREELTQRMREQIMWVPDDEHYKENWEQLRDNPPAPFNRFTHHRIPKWLLVIILALLSPLFLVSLVFTIPLWTVWLLIRWTVKDPAFHNSVQYVWQVICIPLTLFITLPFWIFLQEYMYQVRQLKR